MRDYRTQAIFICAYDNARMILTQGKYSLFYRCSHYFHEHRGPNDQVCSNYLSLRDRTNLWSELEWLEEEGKLIVGVTGRVGSVKYEIIEISDLIVKLAIHNLKVQKKGRERIWLK